MAEALFFNKAQRLWVAEALETAESLTERFFRVDLQDFDCFPYDLQTLAYLQGMEKTNEALAQVCKYEFFRKKAAEKGKEFYRICLQDHKILHTAGTERPVRVKPLLLYVITHELIHVIRFSRQPEIFHLHPHGKKKEEREVHRLTQECLRVFPDPQMEGLLELYRPLGGICGTSH